IRTGNPRPAATVAFGQAPVGGFHGPFAAAAEAIANRSLRAPGPTHVVEIALVDQGVGLGRSVNRVRLATGHVQGIRREIPRRAATAAATNATVAARFAVARFLDI